MSFSKISHILCALTLSFSLSSRIKSFFSLSPGDTAITLPVYATQAHLIFKAATADFLIGSSVSRETHNYELMMRLDRVLSNADL